jgi:DNA-directed RNA polymerase subunit RPC12/RpoP
MSSPCGSYIACRSCWSRLLVTPRPRARRNQRHPHIYSATNKRRSGSRRLRPLPNTHTCERRSGTRSDPSDHSDMTRQNAKAPRPQTMSHAAQSGEFVSSTRECTRCQRALWRRIAAAVHRSFLPLAPQQPIFPSFSFPRSPQHSDDNAQCGDGGGGGGGSVSPTEQPRGPAWAPG